MPLDLSKVKKILGFRPYALEQQIQWILTRQQVAGWYLDIPGCHSLLERIDRDQTDILDRTRQYIPFRAVQPYKGPINEPFKKKRGIEVKAPFKRNGDYAKRIHTIFPDKEERDRVWGPFTKIGEFTERYSSNVLSWYSDERDLSNVIGSFSRVQFEQYDLNSPAQVKDFLFTLGWKPTEWNYKKDKVTKRKITKKSEEGRALLTSGEANPVFQEGTDKYIRTSPQLTEDSFKSLTVGVGADVAHFLVLRHRKGLVEGYLRNVRPDGRIVAGANPIGTPTYRFTHRTVANVPKNDPEVILGKEMRSVFSVPEGRDQVGYDASGLEARMESHYTHPIDPEYALELIDGDSHQRNADKWGVGRSIAKNGKYALTYGAFPSKLASTLGISKREAQNLFDSFWSDDNPLHILNKRLLWQYSVNGYITGLDGRRIVPRKESDLLNYLFQSAGAIIMKRATVWTERQVMIRGLDAIRVGDFHDEGQYETDPSVSRLVGELGVQGIIKAGEYYNLNIPLDGDYSVGRNWANTH